MIRKQRRMLSFAMYRGIQRIVHTVLDIVTGGGITKGCLDYHHVRYHPDNISIVGLPIIHIGEKSKVEIGKYVSIVSGVRNGIDNAICCKINVKDYATHWTSFRND